LPLGDAYTGECLASANPFQPDEQQMREVCNLGYGRGRCDRFPEQSPSDAIRFHIARDEGELLSIQYVREKDCWPQSHGVFECSSSNATLENAPADDLLRQQASAFVQSYLRRRS
jgi:hypothetical protein